MQEYEHDCLLGKSDLKNAFRLLPLAVGNFGQLGFKLNNKYYFNKSLIFGCPISYAIFEKNRHFP